MLVNWRMMSFSILLLLLGTFWGSAFTLWFCFSALLWKRIRLNGSGVYNNDVNTVHPASFLGLHTLVTCSTKFIHSSLVVWNSHTASNKYAEAYENKATAYLASFPGHAFLSSHTVWEQGLLPTHILRKSTFGADTTMQLTGPQIICNNVSSY